MVNEINSQIVNKAKLPSFNEVLTYQRALGIIVALMCHSDQYKKWDIASLYFLVSKSIENDWYNIFFDDEKRPVGCICWHYDKCQLEKSGFSEGLPEKVESEAFIYIDLML